MTSNHQNPVLQIKDVVKRYGKQTALDGISLQVQSGQFAALLGPNGAGKSTLFQLLSGLFVADKGDINVLGHDIRIRPTVALAGIGVVFQQATLDLDLSVDANLRFHTRLHGLPAKLARQRLEQELERLDMLDYQHAIVRTLSGGNRRKIELARALLHDPALLLMDEATVGLDPASRRQLLHYVQSLCAQRGVGVLWATHLVDEADDAHQLIVLHKGQILFSGTPAQMLAQHRASNENGGELSLADAFMAMTAVGKKQENTA